MRSSPSIPSFYIPLVRPPPERRKDEKILGSSLHQSPGNLIIPPYINVETKTTIIPKKKPKFNWNPNNGMDRKHVKIVASAQANPFKRLSAYLITCMISCKKRNNWWHYYRKRTAATHNPPNALFKTIHQTENVNPWNNEFGTSYVRTGMIPTTIENAASWMLRTHIEGFCPEFFPGFFIIFSK